METVAIAVTMTIMMTLTITLTITITITITVTITIKLFILTEEGGKLKPQICMYHTYFSVVCTRSLFIQRH